MQITKNKVGPCAYELRIGVDADAVARAFARAYREFSEVTRVPGFRPGKAPRKVLERFVNQSRLEEHVMELLAAPALKDALASEKMQSYGETHFEPGDLAEGEPWEFLARVSVEPVVTLGDISGVKVERPVLPVTDDDVERSFEALRRRHAVHQPVEGRGVERGDVVIVKMSIQAEGEDTAEERRSIIPIGENIPGFDEALLGQTPDETREFDLRFPDDYDDASRAGRQAHFVVTVVAVNTRELPEPTDEWMQSLGEASSLAEYREQERLRLRQRFDAYGDEIASSRAISALVEQATIEYPRQMVEEEVDRSLRNLAAELERAHTTYDEYLQMGGLTREQHEDQLEAQADQRIRTRLALREFASQQGLKVTKDETDQAVATTQSLAEASSLPVGRSAAEHTYSLLNQVLHGKVTERLREMMEFVDTDVEGPGAAEEAKGETDA